MDEGAAGERRPRDEAAARTARVKRWVAGGALALTGAFSAVAAQALPASHSKARAPSATAPAAVPGDESGDEGAPLISPPAQAPQPSAGSSGAVSGGS